MEKTKVKDVLVIGSTTRGPHSIPIIIRPKISPISWWEFWRWHLISKRRKQVKECIKKIHNIFGEPNEKVKKLVNVSLKEDCSIMMHLRGAIYEHDCNKCVYLGGVNRDLGGGEKPYDLYFCEQNGLPTVSARYGNKGPEYISGMAYAELYLRDNPDHPLAVALILAKERKLLPEGY